MIILWIFAFMQGIGSETGVTPYEELVHVDNLSNIAELGDAEHRGPRYYDHKNPDSGSSSEVNTDNTESTSGSTESKSMSSSKSSEASSFETDESRMAARVYRTCTPCPQDMLKKRNNIGIKWICGGYQRARRSFKSLCMMRYRNCEDGTLFVKIHDHRCKNDTYHGRHWFYVYKV